MNPQPNRFFQISLVFLVALNLIPHFNDYTVPTLAVGGVCLVWRLLYEFQYVPLPNFFTKFGLVISLSYLIFLNYGTLFGLEAGSALLICAASLKLVDRVAYRDAMVLLFLNFMLLLARFFESQTLGITIFAFFDLIITTALLVQLHSGAHFKFDLITLLKTGLRLSLQIAPFMILLFFVFPRFSTQFIRAQGGAAKQAGFSDKIDPGSVAKLAESNVVAFRVRFNGEAPQMIDRYWRGAVLSTNNSMSWGRGSGQATRRLPPPESKKGKIEQEILLEPLFNNWLFTLDYPVWIQQRNSSIGSMTRFGEGDIYFLQKSYNKKFVYDVFSTQKSREPLSTSLRKKYLQTPKVEDPRVLDLVSQIQKNNVDGEQIALRLMKFYHTQFLYTLKPGQMKSNELGEFLFEKKKGFCEHFAASFAAVLRMANVPSRVVVGFHGGRKNDLSDYYIITSRDAHAWTEVWSDKKEQWLRFDPTVMVSPMRQELGGDIYHSLSEQELQQRFASQDGAYEIDSSWLQKGLLAYDALATNWNLFLLNYDQAGQESFFARLGIGQVNQNLLLTISLLILLIFFLWVRLTTKSKEVAESAVQKSYMNLRKYLLKKGLEKEAFEGPSDFLNRCQKELPEVAEDLESFRQIYLESEYGLRPPPSDFNKIIQRIL